jgi:hypothetical protein
MVSELMFYEYVSNKYSSQIGNKCIDQIVFDHARV